MEFTTRLFDSFATTDATTSENTREMEMGHYNSSMLHVAVDLDELLFHNILYKIVVPTMFAIIMGVGVVGNTLVIYITLTYRAMKTTVNLLLLNLAASDLLFLVVAVPFIAYHYAADNWLIGDIACKLSHYILYVTVYVTVYTLVAIAIVRFVSIVRSSPCPVAAHTGNQRFMAAVVAAIWVTMLGVNSPLLALYRVKSFVFSPDAEPYFFCGLQDHQRYGPPLFISFFAFTYIIPLSIIVTMYFLIVRYLVARRQSLSSNERVESSDARGSDLRRLHSRRTKYASRVFLAVVVVFGVCWLPMHTHLIIAYFGLQPQNRKYAVFRVFCHCLAYSNSCVNPFVYHYVSADFRRCLKDLSTAVTAVCSRRQPRRCHERTYLQDDCTLTQQVQDAVNAGDQTRY